MLMDSSSLGTGSSFVWNVYDHYCTEINLDIKQVCKIRFNELIHYSDNSVTFLSHVLIIKANKTISQIYFGKEHYMFRIDLLPIIRSLNPFRSYVKPRPTV
jgi:hypothetical protein